MSEFFAALSAFLIAHLVPAAPGLRSSLVAVLGRRLYLALYSLLSIALLTWVIIASRRAETVLLWTPAPWQRWVPLLAMPFAIWLVIAGLAQPNALSVSLRASTADRKPGAIVAVTRHPVLWGFLLWALAHIPPNGDLAAVALFAALSLFAAAGMVLADARARKRLGADAWARLAERTSLVPFAAIATGRSSLRWEPQLAVAAASAIGIYLWFLLAGHQDVLGVDPRAGL